MPSEEYSNMIKRGEWLEGYLKPAIKAWDFRDLAQAAADMYDIYHYSSITQEYAISELVRFIEDQLPERQAFYKHGLGVKKYQMIAKGQDPLSIRDYSFLPDGPLDYVQKFIEKSFEVYWFRAITRQLFQKIEDLERWEDAFLPDGSNTEYAYETLPDFYSRLYQEIGIDPETRVVKTLNAIDAETITCDTSNAPPSQTTLNFFPWPVIVSRIVFDFLFAGGGKIFSVLSAMREIYRCKKTNTEKILL